MPAGYSGTPLVKKLGIKEGYRVATSHAPDHLSDLLGQLPDGARLVALSDEQWEIGLVFARTSAELSKGVTRSKKSLTDEGALWLCWPKKTSPLARDLTGNIVRQTGLSAGLVDIKVCAIDEDWSGLKFVVRIRDRKKTTQKK